MMKEDYRHGLRFKRIERRGLLKPSTRGEVK